MRQSGVYISTSESIVFQLLGDSKHPKFKEMSKDVIQMPREDSGLVRRD
jgi:hypothetical protein